MEISPQVVITCVIRIPTPTKLLHTSTDNCLITIVVPVQLFSGEAVHIK